MSHRRNPRSAVAGDAVDVIETEMTRLARTIAMLTRPPEAESGVDRAGYLLLRTLERIGPASINALAAAVGLDGSTVTRQVSAMQSIGLVDRETNPGDRRSCIIRPTPDGRNVMRAMRRHRRTNLDAATSDWTDDDRTALGRLLAKLNDSITRAAHAGDPAIMRTAG